MYILTTLPLSADSGLLTVKHVQKHDHTQACKQMNERHQNSVRSNRTRRKRRDVTDEAQRQNHGQQYHADQGEQRRTLEAHSRDYTPGALGVAVDWTVNGAVYFRVFLTVASSLPGAGFLCDLLDGDLGRSHQPMQSAFFAFKW